MIVLDDPRHQAAVRRRRAELHTQRGPHASRDRGFSIGWSDDATPRPAAGSGRKNCRGPLPLQTSFCDMMGILLSDHQRIFH